MNLRARSWRLTNVSTELSPSLFQTLGSVQKPARIEGCIENSTLPTKEGITPLSFALRSHELDSTPRHGGLPIVPASCHPPPLSPSFLYFADLDLCLSPYFYFARHISSMMSRACKRSRDPERARLMRSKGVTTEMLQAKVFLKSEADISRTTCQNYQRMETSWIAYGLSPTYGGSR